MQMPHEGCRRKREASALCLQPPAHVHIIARTHEQWIEPLNGEQRVASKPHVATGDMFCSVIVQQHMRGRAWCARNALRHWRIIRRHHVGTADADDV